MDVLNHQNQVHPSPLHQQLNESSTNVEAENHSDEMPFLISPPNTGIFPEFCKWKWLELQSGLFFSLLRRYAQVISLGIIIHHPPTVSSDLI